MKTRIAIIIAIVVVVGAVLLWYKPSSAPGADYKSATYIIDGATTTLVNGYAEAAAAPGSASKTITRYFGNEATGDLTGNGTNDTAFLLTQTGGGSGTFYYVVAALQTQNGYAGTNAILLGDRIAPQTTEIKNGEIIVNYADRKPSDPMTAQPSVGVSRYFRVENGMLVEVVWYQNDQYGFTFSLPPDWRGYSVVTSQWKGFTLCPSGECPSATGTEILIRNPKWTKQNPWQDIPIMVFTLSEWNAVATGTLITSAAPIAPQELGRNDTYVFALPPRYDYAYPNGWQEVESIITGNPLRAFSASR